MNATASRNGPDRYAKRSMSAPPPVNSTDSELWRWNSSSQVPRPTEPITSAMMLAVMKTFNAPRPIRLTAVPPSRITRAISACSPPEGASMPMMLATKPAAPSATVAIAITSVHM